VAGVRAEFWSILLRRQHQRSTALPPSNHLRCQEFCAHGRGGVCVQEATKCSNLGMQLAKADKGSVCAPTKQAVAIVWAKDFRFPFPLRVSIALATCIHLFWRDFAVCSLSGWSPGPIVHRYRAFEQERAKSYLKQNFERLRISNNPAAISKGCPGRPERGHHYQGRHPLSSWQARSRQSLRPYSCTALPRNPQHLRHDQRRYTSVA